LNKNDNANELRSIEVGLRQAFPNLELGPLRLLAHGFGSVAVEDGRHVFRIARTKRTAQNHGREVRLLPRLAPLLPVLIPLPRWRIESSSSFPHGAIGYEKMSGEQLSSDHLATLSRKLIDDVTQFLVRLHEISHGGLTDVELRGPKAVWSDIHELHRRVLPLLSNLLTASE
jgi:hypothetical protein